MHLALNELGGETWNVLLPPWLGDKINGQNETEDEAVRKGRTAIPAAPS